MASEMLIHLREDELSWLIQQGCVVDLAFGPGWAALKWEEGTPISEAIRLIGMKRGVLNENMEGAGI